MKYYWLSVEDGVVNLVDEPTLECEVQAGRAHDFWLACPETEHRLETAN